MSEEKKIIIDEDWKSQVEREREEAESEPTPAEQAEASKIPPASFPMLVTSIGTQAMMALGQVPDPVSGKPIFHPELARHHIDTLAVLQEKTAGNLDDDEKEMLENFVGQLQQLFVALQSSGFSIPDQPENLA